MPSAEETANIMACQPQVKSRIAALLLALALLLPAGSARAAEDAPPTARDLLNLVRFHEISQDREFSGQLRTSSSSQKIIIPFRLGMHGKTIIYTFADPAEAYVLNLNEKSSRLDHVTGSGRTEKVTGAKLDAAVRGTDISYEDLTLKFLYWNNAVVEKEKETLMSRSCWIVRAVPSAKGESQYDMVRLWIESTGGLLQAECYSGGKLIRRFKVVDVQSAHGTGGYILKSLRIQRVDASGKDSHPTYLEIKEIDSNS